MSHRRTAAAIAVLFIVQVLTAAVGNTFVQSFIDGGPGGSSLTLGVSLMMFSGALIVAIGALLYHVLKTVSPRLAAGVLSLRILEGVVAVGFGIYLLTRLRAVPNHLLWVFVLAGAAGVILCYVLLIWRMVPRPIAALGLVGYSLLLLGVPLDVAGVVDMNSGLGQAFLVPGGVFEVIVLPIWLIVKGFTSPAARSQKWTFPSAAVSAPVQSSTSSQE